MIEIKKGHFLLTEAIIHAWKAQGVKYIKGKVSDKFPKDKGGTYVHIKPYWSVPHFDLLNLFVHEIESTLCNDLLTENKGINYIVNYQQL